MSLSVIALIASITFCIGLVIGSYTRAIVYDNQDWQVFRWSKDTLGYRPIILGAYVKRDDNVIMALRLNTESIPDEGYQLTED
jgi:hypothetical protein